LKYWDLNSGPPPPPIFFFDWGLNSWLHNCKAGAVPLEPHLQTTLLWLFWRWGGLMKYLQGLALNCDPPE
jgi:hypothetical protein